MLIISYLLLIAVSICGIGGLFLFKDYAKKIAALAVTYSAIIVLLSLIAYENNILEKILPLFISLLLIFSINLMIAIGIIKNIGEVKNDNQEIKAVNANSGNEI